MRLHSSVWTMPPEVERVLAETSFPRHPQLSAPPAVLFGTYTSPPGGEAVIVSAASRRTAYDPHTGGDVGVDELHELEIVITSNVPGLDALEAWERLATLGRTVEDAFRDRHAGNGRGKPILSPTMTEAGVRQLWLRAPETQVIPWQGTSGSWLALAQYVLAWQARI